MSSFRSENSPLNLDVFNTLVDSFEAKKKCAFRIVSASMPADDVTGTTCPPPRRCCLSLTRVSRTA